VNAGCPDLLVKCLESFDTKVRESAAFALGSIAQHTEQLAQAVVAANAIQLLIRAVQDPRPDFRVLERYIGHSSDFRYPGSSATSPM
jgi:HEAT repeat protein